jgi:hypothetical protein
MNQPVILQIDHLKAAALFVGNGDKYRPVLDDILLGQGMIAATNGNTGIIIRNFDLDELLFDAVGLPTQALTVFLKSVDKTAKVVTVEQTGEIEFWLKAPGVSVPFQYTGVNTYPDMKVFAEQLGGIKHSFMQHQYPLQDAARFVKAAKILECEHTRILTNAERMGPDRVCFEGLPDVYGLWMPTRQHNYAYELDGKIETTCGIGFGHCCFAGNGECLQAYGPDVCARYKPVRDHA